MPTTDSSLRTSFSIFLNERNKTSVSQSKAVELQQSIPQIPDVFPRIKEFLDTNPKGCCLAMFLVQEMTSDVFVDVCLREAKAHQHPLCQDLALLVRRMSEAQRKRLVKKVRQEILARSSLH